MATEKSSLNQIITQGYILFSLHLVFKQIASSFLNLHSSQSFYHIPNLRGYAEVEGLSFFSTFLSCAKSMSQKMMWSWQPSFCVESAHCAKTPSPWSPLWALHEMTKSGIVTQQLIRMTITPSPWWLASLPDCSSNLALEDGLASISISLSPVITPKV